MGHKLQLSVGEGLKTPETHQVDRLLTETYGIFSHSGQRRERLGKVYDELNNAIDELHADAKMKSTKRQRQVRFVEILTEERLAATWVRIPESLKRQLNKDRSWR